MSQLGTAAPDPVAASGRTSSRRPLSSRQRIGAIVAGAVTMPLLVAGTGVAAVLIGLLAVGFAFSQFFVGSDQPTMSDSSANVALVVIVGLSVVAVFLIIAASFVLSWRMLVSFGITRPAATTWVSLAVSLVPTAALAVLLFSAVNASTAGADALLAFGGPALFALAASATAEIVAGCAIGLFVWWWMAHLFRARVAT